MGRLCGELKVAAEIPEWPQLALERQGDGVLRVLSNALFGGNAGTKGEEFTDLVAEGS